MLVVHKMRHATQERDVHFGHTSRDSRCLTMTEMFETGVITFSVTNVAIETDFSRDLSDYPKIIVSLETATCTSNIITAVADSRPFN